MNCKTPTESDLIVLLREKYDIDGGLQRLAGEVDINYRVSTIDTTYLLKVCKPDVLVTEIEFQVSLIDFLQVSALKVNIPRIIRTTSGEPYVSVGVGDGRCSVRVHSWVNGRMLDTLTYRSPELLHSWGSLCGSLSAALQNYDHPGAHRQDSWSPRQCLAMRKYRSAISDGDKVQLLDYFFTYFELSVSPYLDSLRYAVNYSDAHDQNILVDNRGNITGLIDFGDAIFGPVISELAIACAYAGMYMHDPITAMCHVVRGYVEQNPLIDLDLEVLFGMTVGRLLITVSMAANNLKENPENEYLQVSADPAWDLLRKLRKVQPDQAHYRFRAAAGLEPNPHRKSYDAYCEKHPSAFSDPIAMDSKSVSHIDLSVGSLTLGNNANFLHLPTFEKTIRRFLEDAGAEVAIGGYGEIRPIYTTDAYRTEGNSGPQWRTMHLGTDYWTTEGTAVVAVHDGVVHSIQDNNADCDYGPTIILEHKVGDRQKFYTLYGHLGREALDLEVGSEVLRGDRIATVGSSECNGGWPPHLHFQIILDLFGNEGDFPGVCYVQESETWLSNSPQLHLRKITQTQPSISEILDVRHRHLGRSLSVSYDDPLHIVRGYGQYLYDINGRRYLDTVNNVAHVGHEHPRVVSALSKQASLLNTNTRYLHSNITRYADALAERCPAGLDVVYFVNSGSEANELALRMAKVWSGQKDVIALASGYHGNTGATVDVSSYKFDGVGGQGAPEYTSVVPMPDIYRGAHKDAATAGDFYASSVRDAIERIGSKGRGVAAFLAESILSCGGQIVLPDGYLAACYSAVRSAGGLCISDEVQVGFGRVGDRFWGFELQDVVPDIMVCGKPIGNGHPLGAVVTTRAVSDAFTNGMEYFNTYGGNPVSCAVGMEVLNIIKDENLQENAREVGSYLKFKLNDLMRQYPLIGDVRGYGLFLGIELVRDRTSLEPADIETSYIANRMRQLGILMSTDGPLHNVLKIKPPMCFNMQNADELVVRFESVLSEL